jgi:hypothetical protein
VPTQPLLDTTTLIDEIVAMVDQQLDLDVNPFTFSWARQIRFAKRNSGDRERVDRVRLPAFPARPPLRDRQLRRHPHQLLTASNCRSNQRVSWLVGARVCDRR